MAYNLRQRRAGRLIKRFMRRRAAAYRARYARKGMGIRRTVMTKQNEPMFVETYKKEQFDVVAGGAGLYVWKVRITDIPQLAQYAALYKQYRINWVKHILIPEFAGDSQDGNSAVYNASTLLGYLGMSRIAYAIQDSPDVQAPANEQEVLECNGAKTKVIGKKFSVAHKPVPDVQAIVGAGGNQIWSRQKFKQWFNFDTVFVGNNPEHGAIQVCITQPGANLQVRYHHYVKISFSLRDPQ